MSTDIRNNKYVKIHPKGNIEFKTLGKMPVQMELPFEDENQYVPKNEPNSFGQQVYIPNTVSGGLSSMGHEELRRILEGPGTERLVDVAPDPSILVEAEGIVNGARRSDYGPDESFQKMADIYNTLYKKDLTKTDICRILMVVKLVRESFRHKRDNLVDLAGYAELLNRMEE